LGGCKEERKGGKEMEILGNEKRKARKDLGRQTSDELEVRTSKGAPWITN
jgi:hypothetical protein